MKMPASEVAIVGVSFELPQKATDEESFWDILQDGKNVMTEWPDSRINIETFHSSSKHHGNKVIDTLPTVPTAIIDLTVIS